MDKLIVLILGYTFEIETNLALAGTHVQVSLLKRSIINGTVGHFIIIVPSKFNQKHHQSHFFLSQPFYQLCFSSLIKWTKPLQVNHCFNSRFMFHSSWITFIFYAQTTTIKERKKIKTFIMLFQKNLNPFLV